MKLDHDAVEEKSDVFHEYLTCGGLDSDLLVVVLMIYGLMSVDEVRIGREG